QVRADEVEGAASHAALERADLAQHAGDGGIAAGDLQDGPHVVVGHRRHHFTFEPGGRSRSGITTPRPCPPSPASTMPCDSMPISFAGCRFATTTTFLPTRSAGA